MALDLISNNNSEYQQEANILTNTPGRVSVIVEDEYDIPFWNDLLNNNSLGLYFEITPYEYATSGNYDLRNGKATILAQCDTLGKYKIACLDSDYDYVNPTSVAGQKMKDSPYILQTYAYAVENYNCHSATLKNLCVCATCHSIEFEFDVFITKYSRIVYPLLVWSIWLHRLNLTVLDFSTFNDCVKFGRQISDESWQEVLDEIQEKVGNKVSQLIALHGDEGDIYALKSELEQRCGLTEDNAYLFMNGHILQDRLVESLLFPYCNRIKNEHIHELCASARTDEERNNRMNHYKDVTNRSLTVLLASNFEYKSQCSLYHLLENDIRNLLSLIDDDLHN